MQREDLLMKMIERLFSALKKLLKINIETESNKFEEQANILLKDYFDFSLHNIEDIPLDKLSDMMKNTSLQKPIIFLFLKLALLKSEYDFVTGQKLYNIALLQLLPAIKMVNLYKKEEDLILEQLLESADNIYKGTL